MIKKILLAWLSLAVFSCTNNPTTNPESTSAQANMDQAKALDSIHAQLKRIADLLEKQGR